AYRDRRWGGGASRDRAGRLREALSPAVAGARPGDEAVERVVQVMATSGQAEAALELLNAHDARGRPGDPVCARPARSGSRRGGGAEGVWWSGGRNEAPYAGPSKAYATSGGEMTTPAPDHRRLFGGDPGG